MLLPSFPNVTIIALRIQQTIGISNCEGEHSFSTLSHVKNHLRATTSQYRLDHLAVMSIESDLLRALDVTTKPLSARSSRPLRSADRCDLLVPWPRTSLSQNRAFAVVGPALWNDTPPALRSVMLQGMSSASYVV